MAVIHGMMAAFMKDPSRMESGMDLDFSRAVLVLFLTLAIGVKAKDMERWVRTPNESMILGDHLLEQQVLLWKGFAKMFCAVVWSYAV